MNLLPVETWVLHYTYKHYLTSAYPKIQEEIVLRRGAAKNFYCKAKNGSAYKTTTGDLVFILFCAVGNARQHYKRFLCDKLSHNHVYKSTSHQQLISEQEKIKP